MATHSNILAWRIPWTEEPGGYSPWVAKSRTWLKWLNTHAIAWWTYQTRRHRVSVGNNLSTIIHGKCVKVSTTKELHNWEDSFPIYNNNIFAPKESLASMETQRGQAACPRCTDSRESGPQRGSAHPYPGQDSCTRPSEVGNFLFRTSLSIFTSTLHREWTC